MTVFILSRLALHTTHFMSYTELCPRVALHCGGVMLSS